MSRKWLTSDLPTAELLKQIKGVKGAGDYAAENLLKLLGRYDGSGAGLLDSREVFSGQEQRPEGE